MSWLAYHFKVTPVDPGSDILMAVLSEQGFETFEQKDDGFTAYIKKELSESFTPSDLSFDGFTFTCRAEEMPDQNWNEEWEKHFDPVIIGNRLTVRAPFHTHVTPAEIDIVIMPKMSFGTGHHHTTRLMCEAMLNMNFSGKRVLDMGCGTGILAILAARLGATDILAVDIDEWPVENAKENCRNNDAGFITVKQGDAGILDNEPPFDIIIANINRNVLMAHLPTYARKLKPGGLLLLSGFLRSDVSQLSERAGTVNLGVTGVSQSGDWVLMALEVRSDQ